MRPPRLTMKQILGWVDAWYRQTEKWPKKTFGRIPGSLGENWRSIDNALIYGLRGLPGRSSLARLLAKERGVRHGRELPALIERQIQVWLDEYQRRTGSWPTRDSDFVSDAPGETWQAIDSALKNGRRGLPGGSSLADLLWRCRGVPISMHPKRLPRKTILKWADAFRLRHGRWPSRYSGAIPGTVGETWTNVDQALRKGLRGLPAGGSLPRLLAKHRSGPLQHK